MRVEETLQEDHWRYIRSLARAHQALTHARELTQAAHKQAPLEGVDRWNLDVALAFLEGAVHYAGALVSIAAQRPPGDPAGSLGPSAEVAAGPGYPHLVILAEYEYGVELRIPELGELLGHELGRTAYSVPAGTPEAARNLVANRIHRAMLGFPQDPGYEGGTPAVPPAPPPGPAEATS